MTPQRVYLDHAATSFPKPAPVLAAVRRWFDELGVSAERGDSDACAIVATEVARVRAELARRCGVPADRVAFCSGATEAINLFLRGYLRSGARVLTTTLEHSSIVRPLVALRDEADIRVDVIDGDPIAGIDPQQIEDAMRARRFDLLAFTAASNVTGCVVDQAALTAIARQHGCATLCDASQTAGLLPLDHGADAVAASAHKSLLAPPGLGFLAVRAGLGLRVTKQGGTGSAAALERHPETWPTAFEPGTPNTPAIFGLGAALDWIGSREAELLAHEVAICEALERALPATARCFTPSTSPRLPITSFVIDGLDPAEAGIVLAEAGIDVRTGFHCAPWIHEALGTGAGGTIRVSPGPFNAEADALRVADALLGP